MSSTRSLTPRTMHIGLQPCWLLWQSHWSLELNPLYGNDHFVWLVVPQWCSFSTPLCNVVLPRIPWEPGGRQEHMDLYTHVSFALSCTVQPTHLFPSNVPKLREQLWKADMGGRSRRLKITHRISGSGTREGPTPPLLEKSYLLFNTDVSSEKYGQTYGQTVQTATIQVMLEMLDTLAGVDRSSRPTFKYV